MDGSLGAGLRRQRTSTCELHRRAVRADAVVELRDGGEPRRLHLCADHLAELHRTLEGWWPVSERP